jgi:hypothetical protein
MAERVGALEALLLRVEPTGWRVTGATRWKNIRKYTAGSARGDHSHGDVRNVLGLVLQAFENACEIVAFSRDTDADDERAAALHQGIAQAALHFSTIAIIGGPARPALEGWILALLGQSDTDGWSRNKANEQLKRRNIAAKHAEDYVAIIEGAPITNLPSGCASLRSWLDRAGEVLPRAVHGARQP